MVTIKVPRKRLMTILRLGFSISPSMNVTLFHASLLNMEPTMLAAIAPNIPAPITPSTPPPALNFFISNAPVQFALHTSGLKNMMPAIINPKRERILVEVKRG